MAGLVMAGLVPAIHVLSVSVPKTWMPGTRPGMTRCAIRHPEVRAQRASKDARTRRPEPSPQPKAIYPISEF